MRGATRATAMTAAAAMAAAGWMAAPAAGAGGDRPGAQAAAAAKCRLSGRVVARTAAMKIVRRRQGDSTVLVACLLDTGRTRSVEGVSDTAGGPQRIATGRVAGTWVVSRSSANNQAGVFDSWTAYDVRSGRSYRIADSSDPYLVVGGRCDCRRVAALRLSGTGQAIVLIQEETRDSLQQRQVVSEALVAFSPRGERTTLDSGPPGTIDPASVTLDGHVASWARGAETRWFRFPFARTTDVPPRPSAARLRRCGLFRYGGVIHGRILALVDRPGGARACVLATGRSRLVPGDVRTVRGTWLLLERRSGDRYQGHTYELSAFDARSGRSYQVLRTVTYPQQVGPSGVDLPRVLLSDRGQVLAAFRTYPPPAPGQGPSTPDRTRIVAFSPTGAARELDAGPPAEVPFEALELDGHTAVWRHGAEIRYARL